MSPTVTISQHLGSDSEPQPDSFEQAKTDKPSEKKLGGSHQAKSERALRKKSSIAKQAFAEDNHDALFRSHTDEAKRKQVSDQFASPTQPPTRAEELMGGDQ